MVSSITGCRTPPVPKASWHVEAPSDARPVRITIAGEIHQPGSYTFPTNPMLSTVVQRAGGFTDMSFLRRIRISRQDGSVENCDFWQVKKRPELDVILQDGDRIDISRIPL